MRAAIYTRFSTDQQQSTEMQVEKCREYATKNNIEVCAIFNDEGQTGTNADRGGFQELIYGATNKDFDCIIIYDITRGSRDVADWFNFRKLMSSLNVKVLSTSEKLGDILNPCDFITELIQVGLGQHQVLSTRLKSIDGKTTKARQGLFQGGFAPLGYDIVNQQYVINENEAKTVRRIFELYASGFSYSQILDDIAHNGLKGKRGANLGKNSLYSIIGNDRYIGHYSWNRNINREMKKWVGKKGENPNRVELLDVIPAIIDMETWYKCSARRGDLTGRAKYKAKESYLLSGKIFCAECNGAFVGHTSTNTRGVKTRSYVCGNKYRTRTCNASNVNAAKIENQVIAKVENWINTVDIIPFSNKIIDEYFATFKVDHRGIKQELEQIETKIKKATLILVEDSSLTSIKDVIRDFEKRKYELLTTLAQSGSPLQITPTLLSAALLYDREHFKELDAETIITRYVKQVKTSNNELVVIGGVFTIGSSGRI